MIVVGERRSTKLHVLVLVPCVTLFFPLRVEAHPWSHMVELDLLHKQGPLQQPPSLLPSTFFSTYTCGENARHDIGGGQGEFVGEIFTPPRVCPLHIRLPCDPVAALGGLIHMAGSVFLCCC